MAAILIKNLYSILVIIRVSTLLSNLPTIFLKTGQLLVEKNKCLAPYYILQPILLHRSHLLKRLKTFGVL